MSFITKETKKKNKKEGRLGDKLKLVLKIAAIIMVLITILILMYGKDIIKKPGDIVIPSDTPTVDNQDQTGTEGGEAGTPKSNVLSVPIWNNNAVQDACGTPINAPVILNDEIVNEIITCVENTIKTSRARIIELQEKKAQYEQAISDLEDQIQELEATGNYDPELMAQLQAQLQMYRDAITETDDAILALVQQINALIPAYQFLVSSVVEYISANPINIDAIEDEISAIEDEINLSSQDIDAIEKYIELILNSDSSIEDRIPMMLYGISVILDQNVQIQNRIPSILARIPQTMIRLKAIPVRISSVLRRLPQITTRLPNSTDVKNIKIRLIKENSWYDKTNKKGELEFEVDMSKFAGHIKLGLYAYDPDGDDPNATFKNEPVEVKKVNSDTIELSSAENKDNYIKLINILREPDELFAELAKTKKRLSELGIDNPDQLVESVGWYYDVSPQMDGVQKSIPYASKELCESALKTYYNSLTSSDENLDRYDYSSTLFEIGTYGCFEYKVNFAQNQGKGYYFDKNPDTVFIEKSDIFATREECINNLNSYYTISGFSVDPIEFTKNQNGEDSIYGCFENNGQIKYYFDETPFDEDIKVSELYSTPNKCIKRLVKFYKNKGYDELFTDEEKLEFSKNQNGENSKFGCFDYVQENKYVFDRFPTIPGIQESRKYDSINECYINLRSTYLTRYDEEDYDKDEFQKNMNDQTSIYGCFEKPTTPVNSYISEVAYLKKKYIELKNKLDNYDYEEQMKKAKELLNKMSEYIYAIKIPVKDINPDSYFALHFEPFDLEAFGSTETIDIPSKAYIFDTNPFTTDVVEASRDYYSKEECESAAIDYYIVNWDIDETQFQQGNICIETDSQLPGSGNSIPSISIENILKHTRSLDPKAEYGKLYRFKYGDYTSPTYTTYDKCV